MSKTRIWRIGTAALAASALLMATVGGATAQTLNDLDDVLDPTSSSSSASCIDGDEEGTRSTTCSTSSGLDSAR
jgi:hypothetical protein